MDGLEDAAPAASTSMSTSMNSQDGKSVKKSKTPKATAKASKKREREEDDADAANVEAAEQQTAAGIKQKSVNEPIEVDEDVEAASRAELRKRRKLEKKKQQQGGEAVQEGGESAATTVPTSASSAPNTGGAASVAAAAAAAPKSGHGVWVGNLSFKTNPDRVSSLLEHGLRNVVHFISSRSHPYWPALWILHDRIALAPAQRVLLLVRTHNAHEHA